MGCVLCNITSCQEFSQGEDPAIKNPFYCKSEQEREEFLSELASNIVTRHPEFLELLNTLAAKAKK